MKLASIHLDGRPAVAAVTDDGRVVPLERVDPALPGSIRGLLADHLDVLPEIGAKAERTPPEDAVADPVYLPLLTDAHAVWCAILNFPAHVTEGNWEPPTHPGFFLRHSTSLAAHGAPIIAPPDIDTMDYEGELAVVIGRGGRRIAQADAMAHVAGYTCFNDGSVREWQRHSTQITAGKNFERTGGFGPHLVTADEVPDIRRCRLRTLLNGQVVQDAALGEMIFPIEELIAYLSTVGELHPGDVIVCGTPGGVGARQDPPRFMQPGDVVEVSIDGIGVLTNSVAVEVA